MRISDWSSDVCSSDLDGGRVRHGVEDLVGAAGIAQPAAFGRTATCTSASCLSGIGDGAPVIRHCAVVVLGKAITSRIDSVPAISAAMRSMPKAMPPCGGAPYLRASGRKPNLASASSAPMPSSSNTALCIDERWMRIEPPPIRSEEHTSELQLLMRHSYAVSCLKNNQQHKRLLLS